MNVRRPLPPVGRVAISGRLLLVTVTLLLLPTATLSLLAGLTLKDREFLADFRIKASALNAVRAVSQRIEERLDEALEDVRVGVSQTLARGGDVGAVESEARRLRVSRPLVGTVYIFMNPWGMVYPAARSEEPDEALLAALRRDISSSRGWQGRLRLAVGDHAYCFRRLEQRRELYVGYRVEPNAFHQALATAVAAFSGGGVTLRASGPSLPYPIVRHGFTAAPEIRDSLDAGSAGPDEARFGGAPALVESRLAPPFDLVRVSAHATDSAELQRAARPRWRLQLWGVALLAGAIALGAWLVLRESASDLQRAVTRGDFVLAASHDLRTPLASLRMLAESLLNESVRTPEARRRFLETMVRECDRLSQMVERVLFFVRFDQGALLLRPEEQVEPGEWLRAVEEVFRARYRLDGAGSEAPAGNDTARFRVEVEDGLPPVAMDRGAMTQALLNLLDNAWKYSFGARQAEEGGAGRDRITLAARRGTAARFPWGRRAGVLLTVRDTGIGIARRDLRRVFRKYYRGELAQHRNVSGVGLGLPFCRFVVRGHGGWIRVRSEPGQGTEFTVFLPAGGGS